MQAYSTDLRIRVLEVAAVGNGTAELADRFSVSPVWGRRLRQCHRKRGEVGPRGRPPGPRPEAGRPPPPHSRTPRRHPRPDLGRVAGRTGGRGRPLDPAGGRPAARVHVQKSPGRLNGTGQACGPPATPGVTTSPRSRPRPGRTRGRDDGQHPESPQGLPPPRQSHFPGCRCLVSGPPRPAIQEVTACAVPARKSVAYDPTSAAAGPRQM